MVFPLIALGVGVGLDFLFQWYFEQERQKQQLALLEGGYSAEDVAYTDVESDAGFFQEYSWDEEPGKAFLQQALFG